MVTRNRRSRARNTMGGVQEEKERSPKKVWIRLATKYLKFTNFRKCKVFL